MGKTNIEWTDFVINPFVGCTKISPGCQNCFAERFAARLAKNPKTAAKYAGVVDSQGHWTGKISRLDLSCFDKLPKRPSRVFVGSMTDVFAGNVPINYIADIFKKIDQLSQHTFLFLTKRSSYLYRAIPYHNVWLGVTVCNQEEADKKISALLDAPAAKRFISVEPMLGSVNIKKYLCGENKLDWVICGGETGAKARPMSEKWVKSLLTQCLEMGTPFFFKSWGEWTPYRSGEIQREVICKNIDDCMMAKVGKRESGHLIDGVEYRQFPEG